MKKIFTLLLFSALVTLGYLHAQQIHGDFDQLWATDTIGNGALPGQYLRPGKQPVGWEASNVHQKVLATATKELVFPDKNRIGGSGYSAKITNDFVGLGTIGSNAPGYITLGVPWVYAIMKISDCDGGTLGGIEYTQRPDSLIGYYKRTIGSEGEENALLLAYLWKGSTTSTVKVNPGGGMASDETTQVIDQDLCILGKTKPDSGDAVLIGKAEYNITAPLTEWTRISIPVEYYEEDIPEKMNIVLSSANYWDRSIIKKGNILWADDVELICNAELKSLKVGDTDLEEFNSKIYEYQLPASEMNKTISAEAWGKNATIDIRTEQDGKVRKIVVTDNTANGRKSYTYTLTFQGEKTKLVVTELGEKAIYGSEIAYEASSNNTETPINISFSDPSIVTWQDGKMKFLKAGQSMMTVSQEAGENYTAAKYQELIDVKPKPLTIQLNDAASKYGKAAVYTFSYIGLTDADTELINQDPKMVFTTVPQCSGYNGSSKVSTSTAIGEYPIRWTNEPIAPNYTITLDNTEKFLTIGKGEVSISFRVGRMEGEENPELKLESINFDGLISADRTYNSSTKTYYPKSAVITGEISAEFTDITPDNDSPAGFYPVTITSTIASEKYDFVVAEENYLMVQKYATIEFVNFPEKVFYGDTVNIQLKVNDNIENPEFLYYSRKYSNETANKTSFPNNDSKMVAIGVDSTKIEVYVKANGYYLQTSLAKEFKIDKAPLTVTTKEVVREMGESNPDIELIYEGFKLGEDETTKDLFISLPTATTTANEESPAGYYEIVVEGGEAANYDINTENAKLTVMTIPTIEIVDFPEKITYGDVVNIQLLSSNNLEGRTFKYYAKAIDDITNVEFSSENEQEMTAIGAGAAMIEVVIEAQEYYHQASVTKELSVNKAPLTVRAQDANRYEGEPNPLFTLVYEGFKLDDDESTEGVFINLPEATTEANENSPEGNYDILVEGGEATNYRLDRVNGNLEVMKRSGIDSFGVENLRIYADNGILYIEGNEKQETISIFNSQGSLVRNSNDIDAKFTDLTLNSIYIVKIGNNAAKVVIK